MKRFKSKGRSLLAILLALCFALPGFAVFAQENDDMTIGGAEPGVQGDAAIARTTEKAHSGNDSLKVTGRNADWHGVTWDVKNALASGGAGTYALEAYVLGVDGETLGYTVNAANANWLGVPAVTLSSANWTRLYGTITVSENDLEAVNREGWATLYPGGSGAGDYYIDDVRLWKIDGDMRICGAEPYAQGGTISYSQDVTPVSGADTLLSQGRGETYQGAAWSVPAASLGDLKTAGGWEFSMKARSAADAMNLTYNFQFWYSGDVNDCKYLSVSSEINSSSWTELKARWIIPEEYLADSLQSITVYPTTGAGQLGDYYLDAPSLVGFSLDDVTIGGAEPGVQGDAAIARTTEKAHSGNDSLKVTGRNADWHGVTWDVKNALASGGAGTYALEAYVLGVDGETLGYTVNAANANWLGVPAVTLSSANWTRLYGTITVSENDLEAVNREGWATLYPGGSGAGDYYIDDVRLWKIDGDMRICGAEPYAQGGTISYSQDVTPVSGADTLLSQGRGETYQGAAWSVPAASLGDLKTAGGWEFSMKARSAADAMNLTYNFQFWYSGDVNDCKYLSVSSEINSSSWTELKARWIIPEEYLADSLQSITVYPTTGAGQLGDYYLDAPSLVGFSLDDMALGGVQPSPQAADIQRVEDMVYTGNDSLYVSNRQAYYSGAAWYLQPSAFQSGKWNFTAYVRAKDTDVNLTYNLELKYADKDWKYYTIGPVTATKDGWVKLSGDMELSSSDLAGLTGAALYPVTGNDQKWDSGDYYIDGVSFRKTGELPVPDDMKLGGAEPSGQGAALKRVTDVVYTGKDSLYVSNREAFYAGAAWYLQPSAFQSGKWNFTAYVRAKDTDVSLTYNLELKYADKDWKYYAVGPVTATKDGWVKLSGEVELTAADLAGLTGATLYPVTGNEKKWDSGDYYIDGVDFKRTGDVSTPDNMKLGGAEPSSQGAALKRVTDVVYTGKDSLYVSNREAFYAGAAWYLQPSAFQSGKWNFTAYVRAKDTDVSLTYNLELKYADKDWKYYAVGPVTATKSGWVKLSGDLELLPSDLEGLTGAALYPVTGNERSWDRGDYYIDGVSFQRTGAADYIDNMTIAGKYFFKHGGDDSFDAVRVTWPVAAGDSALLVQNRALVFAGAGWDVKELLQSGGAGTWTFRASARSAYASQHLAYSVYLRYLDGTEDWLFCAGADIDSGGWVTLSGDAYSTTGHAMDFDNLEIATLYPCTNEGQLGDYYIDNVSFVRTGDAIPTAPSGTNQHYGYDYFPLDGGFEEKLGLGEPGYAFQHGGEVGLSIASGISYEGNHSCYVFNREFPYSGPGYDVTAYLREQGWGNWFFTAWAMAEDEPMTLSYSVYLKFEDGTEDWLYPAYTTYLEPGQWVRVNSDYQDGDSRLRSSSGKTYDFNQLVMATLYPCTGEGELGNFYIDAVSFYKGADGYKDPVFTFEGSFPLDGEFEEVLKIGAPGNVFKHGESSKLERASDVANKGKYSLLVSDRESPYSGPGWVVTDYLKQEGWGDWYFSAYGRASDTAGTLGLGYSIYLQFEDGTEEWLVCGRQTYLSSKGWTRINGDTTGNPIRLSTMNGTTITDFDELTYAVLYPNTDEGMLGDYYIDSVQLWREDPEAVKETGIENETAPTITPEPEQAKGVNWPLVVGLCGGAVLVAAGVTGGIVFYRKRRQK